MRLPKKDRDWYKERIGVVKILLRDLSSRVNFCGVEGQNKTDLWHLRKTTSAIVVLAKEMQSQVEMLDIREPVEREAKQHRNQGGRIH